MKINFITFGSHDNYIGAGKRLINQSKTLNIFAESILYTSDYLKKDVDFWNMHGEFISKNERGYGYWLWKPFIIKKTMENMSDGDILLYLDCGCELDNNRKDELLKCIDIVKTDKLIGVDSEYKEQNWNKMDLIEKLDMNKDIYITTNQRQAGALLFLICDDTRKFVNEWYTICCEYHNIDDSPSILKNIEGFLCHRHDQSVFSLLTKKYEIFSNKTLDTGIYYIRNKTPISKIVNIISGVHPIKKISFKFK